MLGLLLIEGAASRPVNSYAVGLKVEGVESDGDSGVDNADNRGEGDGGHEGGAGGGHLAEGAEWIEVKRFRNRREATEFAQAIHRAAGAGYSEHCSHS